MLRDRLYLSCDRCRRGFRAARFVALVLVPACAVMPVPGGTATLETPAAGALAEWIRIYNLGNTDSSRAFAARAYAASELADRPAEVIARGHQLWRMNYGQMRVVRVDSSAPFAIEATVHEALTETYGKVFVEVDSSPPRGITGVWLIPFVEAPADAPPSPAMTDQELADALGSYTARLEEHDVLSGAVLVARRGRPVFARAFGMAQRDPPAPNILDTRFELASLSKLFTAVAIAQLVDRGRLAFDTPVSTVLPD
jgi:CubicO group peptidase (beta-lactamase class C family)